MINKSWRQKSIEFSKTMQSPKLDFYVTVPGRVSQLIEDKNGIYKEVISPGAFQESIIKNGVVPIYLNHIRKLADIDKVELWEDAIGLRCIAEINDIDLLAKILCGKIKGCSFSFHSIREETVDNFPYRIRNIKKLKLNEVSIVDDTMEPVHHSSSLMSAVIPDKLQVKIYQKKLEYIKAHDVTV